MNLKSPTVEALPRWINASRCWDLAHGDVLIPPNEVL